MAADSACVAPYASWFLELPQEDSGRRLSTITIRNACPATWTEISGRCYLRVDTARHARAAAQHCATLDPYAYLATPGTHSGAVSMLAGLGAPNNAEFWIGFEFSGGGEWTIRSV